MIDLKDLELAYDYFDGESGDIQFTGSTNVSHLVLVKIYTLRNYREFTLMIYYNLSSLIFSVIQ